MRRNVSKSLFAAGVVLLAFAAVGLMTGIRLNLTDSIPVGLYRVTRSPINRGTVVLACLPSRASKFAAIRGYVPSGSCADGRAPIGKVVIATAGDTVDVTALGLSVNGTLLRNTAPLPKDSKGRPLPSIHQTGHVVASDEIWLASSYSARSFDSRYFGGVPRISVISRIQPLLTTGGW